MRRIASLLLVLACLAGCAHRVDYGPRGRIDDPFEILHEVASRYGQIQGLVGEGSLSVDTEQVDGSLKMALEVAQPAQIYLETADLLGTPRGTFATDGERFDFYDPGQDVFYTGPATAEMVGRFLPVALPPEDLAAALLGELPLLLQAEEARLEVDERTGTYVLYLRAGRVRQRVVVATRDLRLLSVETRGIPAIDGHFEAHEELFPGILFPTRLRLLVPRAEVRIRYTDVRLNRPADPASFRLQPPPGTRVEDLER